MLGAAGWAAYLNSTITWGGLEGIVSPRAWMVWGVRRGEVAEETRLVGLRWGGFELDARDRMS